MTQGVVCFLAGMTGGHSFLGLFDRGVIKMGGHPFLRHRQHHLSQNNGPAIAGSARPAYHKQLCAVRYVLDTSHRNAKNLGVLQHPQAPTCLRPC